MRNAGLEETQAGIKIARRNINNFRYADDTTLMAESEEELKSLLMKMKEESEKVGLKFDIQKTKIMASGPITSWEIDGETVETISICCPRPPQNLHYFLTNLLLIPSFLKGGLASTIWLPEPVTWAACCLYTSIFFIIVSFLLSPRPDDFSLLSVP